MTYNFPFAVTGTPSLNSVPQWNGSAWVPSTVGFYQQWLDIRDYGGIADSVTDNIPALNAMVAASQPHTAAGPPNLGSKSATSNVWYIPSVRNQTYHFANTFTYPSNYNITIVSDSMSGAILSCNNDVLFTLDGAGGTQGWRSFRGLAFYQCGVLQNYNVKSNTLFEDCLFYDTPAAAFETVPLAGPGTAGSQVWGGFHRCRFDSCFRAIYIPGSQTDMWRVVQCGFVRGKQADIECWSSNWDIIDCDFEQRDTTLGNIAQPWVNLREAGGASRIIRNRFGLETSGANQPPTFPVIIGPVGSAVGTAYNELYIEGNRFEGRNGGPTATSAKSAIALNCPSVGGYIGRGNTFASYNDGPIALQYATSARGRTNVLANRSHRVFSVASQALLSLNNSGEWQTEENRLPDSWGSARGQLLSTLDLTAWTDTNANTSVAISALAGPDGLTGTAWTLSRTAAGTASINLSINIANGGPVTFWAWFKASTVDPATVGGLRVLRGAEWLNSLNTVVIVDGQWQLAIVTVWPGAASTVELHLAVGVVGSAALTENIEIAYPGVAYGIGLPSWAAENVNQVGNGITRLEPVQVANGTVADTGGTLIGTFTLVEGWRYRFNVLITGTSQTNNHLFDYASAVDAMRPTGVGALLLAGTETVIRKLFYDQTTGALAPVGQADPADFTVVITVAVNTVVVTVTNNDATQDLENTKIMVGYDRTRIV